MAILHLHNSPEEALPQPKELGGEIWETGAWYISEARARTMIGADIHLHEQTNAPSYKAGKITGFERRHYLDPRDGKSKLRTYFHFRRIPGMEGEPPGPGPWHGSGTKWIP